VCVARERRERKIEREREREREREHREGGRDAIKGRIIS
jgi:hypothetical protein